MRYGDQSDAALVAACLAGVAEAWDALLSRYQGFIFALALREGLSRSDADDLFQDVCVKLYRHLGELRDVRRLSGWLAVMVRQEVWGRRRRKSAVLMSDLPPGEQERLEEARSNAETLDPEGALLALEREHFVGLALRDVGGDCQRLLDLLYGPERLAYAEAAAELGWPLGSVGPRRARCLDRLRKKLADFGL